MLPEQGFGDTLMALRFLPALAERCLDRVLSSHLLSDVEDVCDRAVIYYGGKIQAMGTLKDLLCEQDSVRITLPVLPKEKMQKILDLIRKDVAEGDVDVDNPTQNLESYFLEKVNEAKASEEDTSGATSGSQVADYLRGGQPVKTAADKKLERLSAPQEKKKPRDEKPAEPVPTVDKSKLEKLASDKPTAEPKKMAVKKKTAKPIDSGKLSALMGNDPEKE